MDKEKIYKILCSMTVPGEDSTMSASKYWREERYRIAKEILALIPEELPNRPELVEEIAEFLYDKVCGDECHGGGWGQTYKDDASPEDKEDYRRYAEQIIAL